ncbi:TRAP transporter substrate-binding protein [Bacillus benzoevorans]|uniref:C4-dicarboxylate-binding protein DctP n=1 Tax=Bacillus benzoevorans TaxID=1456 RepID=A0A7X0HV26_9BACI|nr:TRAP transporter substrate-binding protein [Bacillus benzoevorans]MBB6447316.1 C4-dicarboxylate-binding protein DctP [Bacillus benzoevorans]
MKHFITASILTIVGLILFIFYDNGYLFHEQKITADEEQNGLKDQIIIHFSHVVAENTPKGLAAQKFSELVYEKTNGRVKVQVYPNGILYSDNDELEALKAGDVQMIAPSFTNMTNIVPQWKVLDLPFLFQDDDHIKRVFTGETGEQLLGYLNEREMKGLAFWSNGFKQMTSNSHPLIEPEDFAGETFRIMPGHVLKRQFYVLGAKPISTAFTEVFSSLEKQVVDGQENTISNIYSKGLYQYQPYLTLSNHGVLGYAVIVNQEFWNSLPQDIRPQIEDAMKESTLWNMEMSVQMNKTQLEELRKMENLHIYKLPADAKARWMERFKPLYREVEQETDPELITAIKEKAAQNSQN